MKRYLMVAEFEDTGYIIGIAANLSDAKRTLNEIGQMAYLYAGSDLRDKMEPHLEGYKKYRINGNNKLIEECAYGTNRGGFSMSAMVIDPRHFSMEMYIKERENNSYIYDEKSWSILSGILRDDLLNLQAN